MKQNRVIRSADLHIVKRDEQDGLYVEGYASTFQPYVLFNDGEHDDSEVIDRHAFDETDMSDVVFLRDHTGAVLARTKNGALTLEIDDHGLLTKVNLGLTEASRQMLADIRAMEADDTITPVEFALNVIEIYEDMKKILENVNLYDKVVEVEVKV